MVHLASGRWSLEVISTKNGVTVQHPGGSQIQATPGAVLEMPSWFDDVYIVITTPSAVHEVGARIGPSNPTPHTLGSHRGPDASTVIFLPQDPGRADYRTALLLCAPMLADPFNRRVPSEGEVAQQLNRLGLEDPPIQARTVERRLARLRERFEVGSNAELRDRLVASHAVGRRQLDDLGGPRFS